MTSVPSLAEIEAGRKAAAELYKLHSRTFITLEGVDSLVRLYGRLPTFHDGELTDLALRRDGTSSVRIRIPYPDIFAHGGVFVTIEIGEIVDVSLEGFSPQNVLGDLYVTPAMPDAMREAHSGDRRAGDFRIELEPIYGIGGFVVGRGLKVAWSKDRRARQQRV
jgi:hypothetical protein